MKKQLLGAVCATLLAAIPAHAQTIAITGGTVYPISGPAIQNGTVLMRDGKIIAVGADVAVPSGAQRIDATGKIVTPGFIDASTTLGLVEIGGEPSTRDANAKGTDAIAASFRSWDGLNSESVMWAPARNEGITSAVVAPSGGLVSGEAAVVDLADGTAAEMIRRAPVAMFAQIDNPRGAQTGARGELIGRIRNLIEDVKFYQTHRADYDRSATRSLTATRVDLEAMIPVV